jgi:uncharacterized protein YaaN involved in tellurite resistance
MSNIIKDHENKTGLDTSYLEKIGLQPSDLPLAQDLCDALNAEDLLQISNFGSDTASKTINTADEMLAAVSTNELGDTSKDLKQVLQVATDINYTSLNHKSFSYPVIGPIIQKLMQKKTEVTSQFNTASDQINSILSEVMVTKQNLSKRNEQIEVAYQSVEEEYYQIGLRIAATKLKVIEMDATVLQLSNKDLKGIESQRLFDLKNNRDILAKRSSDLTMVQKSALQSLPQFRLVQHGNLQLIEKFNTINAIVVPSWRRAFMTSLALKEQESAIELADAIDKAANNLLLKNSDLTKQNTIAAAKANQRLSIDIKTLEKVQADLIETVIETTKITNEGKAANEKAEALCISMQSDFKTLIQSPSNISQPTLIKH